MTALRSHIPLTDLSALCGWGLLEQCFRNVALLSTMVSSKIENSGGRPVSGCEFCLLFYHISKLLGFSISTSSL